MAEATLKDLVQQIRINNKSQEETTGAVQALTNVFVARFKKEDYGSLDKLKGPKVQAPRAKGEGYSPNISLPGEGMFSALAATAARIASLVAGITAGALAVAGAFAGLRGWELKAIENIGKLGDGIKALIPTSVTENITQAIINLRAKILRLFGINPALPTEIDPETNKKIQIKNPVALIGDVYNKLVDKILLKFGIGADGKLIALAGEGGDFKSPKIGRFILQIKSLFRPITKAGELMGEFFTSPFFTKITDVIGSGAKGILKVAQKILWPIGFIISAFDGVNTFINSDKEGLISRLGEGIGAFLGDFVGAPFDLLKSGISWLMTNYLGVSEDSWFMKKFKSFSFDDLISGTVQGIFDNIQMVVNMIKGDFTMFNEKFAGFKSGITDILGTVGDSFTILKDIVVTQVQYQITRIVNGFKNSFDRIATFINNLGDNLYIMLSENLQFSFPEVKGKVPDWLPEWMNGGKQFTVIPGFELGLGDASTRAAAAQSISSRNLDRDNRIAARDSETAMAYNEAQAALSALSGALPPIVINQVDQSNNSQNTSTSTSTVATTPTTDNFNLLASPF
jgi:hypothetical protein